MPITQRLRTKQIKDWRALQPDQLIKVSGRSGPYYQPTGSKEKKYLGQRGVYRVVFVDRRGIGVKSTGLLGSFAYIYMGRKRRWKELSTVWESPHKIRLVVE